LTASGGHNDIYLIEDHSQQTPKKSDFPQWEYAGFKITKL
jgi:hypothetical protein